MHAYSWTSAATGLLILLQLLAALLGARLLDHAPPRAAVTAAWALLVVLLTSVGFTVANEAAGVRMLAFASAALVGMKAVVLAAARQAGTAVLPTGRWLLFTLAWFGMHPRAFSRRGGGAPARALVGRGLRNAAAGALLVWAARATSSPWAIPLLMVGLSLLVHFGLFTLLTAALRASGFRVRVLFDAPLRARSPAEFWAWRWNRGFAEMTSLAVYRPLVQRLGERSAYLAAFAVSGLLHEVAISLPVRAGYGLPTLYFVLQGWFAQRAGREPGRFVTLLGIVLPLPLVFHPWFVDGVIAPLLT